jgi:hypothetical protein
MRNGADKEPQMSLSPENFGHDDNPSTLKQLRSRSAPIYSSALDKHEAPERVETLLLSHTRESFIIFRLDRL